MNRTSRNFAVVLASLFAVSVAVTGCAPGSESNSGGGGMSNNVPNTVVQDAQQRMEDHPETPGYNEAARQTIEEKLGWDKLPDGSMSTTLPGGLGGVVFLGDDGSEVKLVDATNASISTPQDQSPIPATYTTNAGDAALTLTYDENGKSRTITYAAQCKGRKAMLNVLSQTMPKLPSVLRGTLP